MGILQKQLIDNSFYFISLPSPQTPITHRQREAYKHTLNNLNNGPYKTFLSGSQSKGDV